MLKDLTLVENVCSKMYAAAAASVPAVLCQLVLFVLRHVPPGPSCQLLRLQEEDPVPAQGLLKVRPPVQRWVQHHRHRWVKVKKGKGCVRLRPGSHRWSFSMDIRLITFLNLVLWLFHSKYCADFKNCCIISNVILKFCLKKPVIFGFFEIVYVINLPWFTK